MRIYFILLTAFVSLQYSTGKRCPSRSDFKCFWDDECIPYYLKCDGKHDCSKGEDETEWFAGCTNCTGKFHCHKNVQSLECVEKSDLCDRVPDCFGEEDESYEFAKCKSKTSCPRDLAAAAREGRAKCRKPCKKNGDCRPRSCKKGMPCYDKKCLCDYSCGMSCVNIAKTCPPLSKFPNLKKIRYIRRNRTSRKSEETQPPFYYDVRAHHICEPGYEALPSEIRYCHGRTDKTWTREVVCAKICSPKNEQLVKDYKLTCGMACVVEGNCAAGKTCTCDGPCGRTCVNIDVECGDAPPIANGFIEYTGEKFERVAHYICNEGFYAQAGDLSRKCTASGKYDGSPIACKPVTCLDPTQSIERTDGRIIKKTKLLSDGSFPFNTTLHFACGSGQRLLGSSSRTCMANGRWSGLLTICDNIGQLERCPHPGVPIGGGLYGSTGDHDFIQDKWVEFKCNKGLVMMGEREQKCLHIKQWSGNGAPLCVDPRFSDSQSEIIGKLQNNVANIRQVRVSMAGRTISNKNARGKVEVYFVIDLSLSVKRFALRNTIDFAIGLVKRLSQNDTSDRVSYGIVVFATTAKVKLNILELPKKTPKQVIKILNEIVSDIKKIRKDINYGTNIQEALFLVNDRMISVSFQNDDKFLIKRHILVLTDGLHNAGGRPSEARRDIELGYEQNPPEFYSITSSARSSDPATQEELRLIASKSENYVYVDDFYKLHSYIDQVTDVREDYSACGQAGDVGSVRKMVSLGRVIGGSKAAERAWPWQALVTYTHDRVLGAFDSVVGGGSLINDRWVLTAAHLFYDDVGADGWEQVFYVALGIVRRPSRHMVLDGSVKIFIPEKIILHENYMKYNGTDHYGSYQNDIALIKLGGEVGVSSNGLHLVAPTSPGGKVEFTPYIRPVCLPCSVNSCVSEILQKPDSAGKVLINGGEDAKEKCAIEANFLTGKNKKGSTAVILTGFGHNATLSHDQEYITPTHALQQAVLKIEETSKCKNAADRITRMVGNPAFKHIFTNEMLCATGSPKKAGEIIDACKGDSGGPLTREVRDETTKKSCFVQLGIVSWGFGCGQDYMDILGGRHIQYPGFYANVPALMPWITSTMDANQN